MNGLVLGLDIGIASVGVGILNKETGEIIHANSRIFPAATADSNVERRGFRQGRRLGRRKKHRSARLNDLFEEFDFITDFSAVPLNLNPYALRVKGLSEELTNEELFIALLNGVVSAIWTMLVKMEKQLPMSMEKQLKKTENYLQTKRLDKSSWNVLKNTDKFVGILQLLKMGRIIV